MSYPQVMKKRACRIHAAGSYQIHTIHTLCSAGLPVEKCENRVFVRHMPREKPGLFDICPQKPTGFRQDLRVIHSRFHKLSTLSTGLSTAFRWKTQVKSPGYEQLSTAVCTGVDKTLRKIGVNGKNTMVVCGRILLGARGLQHHLPFGIQLVVQIDLF